MGIGACENSVMVEEPLCVPISGTHLCSEFAMQSVSDQQARSELSHSVIDCPDPVSDDGSCYPGSGESMQMSPVDRDEPTGEHEDGGTLAMKNFSGIDSVPCVSSLEEYPTSGGSMQMCNGTGDGPNGDHDDEGTLALENMSKVDSMPSLSSLEEGNQSSCLSMQMGTVSGDGSTGEREDKCTLRLEIFSKTKDGPDDLIGEGELPSEVVLVANLAGGPHLNESIGDVDPCRNRTGECELPLEVIDVAGKGSGGGFGECGMENLPDEDEVGSLVGDCDLPLEVAPVTSLAAGDCLDESKGGDTDARAMEEAGECLHESGPKGEGRDGNQIENHVSPLEAVPVAIFGSGGGCLSENHDDIDGCLPGKAEECSEDNEAQVGDGVENLTREHESPPEVTAAVSLAFVGCPCESNYSFETCAIERDGERLQGSDSGDCTAHCGLPLEDIPLSSGGCPDENQSDVDDCTRERVGEPFENTGPVGDCVLKLEVTPLAELSIRGCLDEYHSDEERSKQCLGQSRSQCEQVAGSEVGDFESHQEVALVPDGGCLNKNHCDIDACTTEISGEFLAESRARGESGIGNPIEDSELPLEVASVFGLASGGCLDEICSSTERVGECLLERKSQGEDDAMILTGGCELPREAIAMADLANENHSDFDACSIERGENCEFPLTVTPMANLAGGNSLNENNIDLQESSSKDEDGFGHFAVDCEVQVANCIHLDGQNGDKSFGCGLAEDIKEATETNDDDALEDVNKDLCDHDSSSQNRERSELVPLDGMLGDTHGTKELDSDCVGGLTVVDPSGVSVTSIESEADTCKKISLSQPCEMSPKLSHSSEELCNWKIDQNKGIGCSSNEMSTLTVGVESNVDTISQVSLATSLEDAYRSDTLSICVPGYEKNENNVDIPSTKGVTESVEEENSVVSGAKVQVVDPMLPLEENPCNDVSTSQSSQPLYNTDDCSSKRLNLLHDNSFQDPLKCTSPVGCFGQIDNQGENKDGFNYVSEAKSGEILSASSQRNSRRSRSNHKTQAKKASGRSKKTAKALSPNACLKIDFKPTKKRSLSRSARSSSWGLLENVTQVFVSWIGLNDVIPVTSKRSRKSNGGRKTEKKNKNRTTERATGSKKRCHALSTTLRLKVKIGKAVDQSLVNSTVPELVDTSALSTAICGKYGTELCTKSPRAKDKRKGEVSEHFKCLTSDEDNTCCPGAPVQDTHPITDSSRNLVSENLTADSSVKYFGVSSNVLVEVSETTEDGCKDPGTSPDSEVINVIPDSHTDPRPHDDFGSVVSSSKDPAAPGGLASNKRGNNRDTPSSLSSGKAKLPQAARKSRAKPLKQYGRKQKCKNGIYSEGNLNSSGSENLSSNLSSGKEPSIVEPSLVSKETAVSPSTAALKVESGAEAYEINCDLDTGAGLSKSENSKKPHSASKDRKLPISKSWRSDSRMEKVNARNKGENPQRSVGKKKINKKSFDDQVTDMVENQPEAENHVGDDNGKTNAADSIVTTQEPNLDMLPCAIGEQYIPPRNAWVRCDSCHKWRRIAAELADTIEETQCTWTCKDNLDKSFADCSTPQEKSNSDINAELDISDASGDEDAFRNRLNKGLECTHPRERQESVTCTTIRTNQFLHRNRKTQTIDEIMICHCKAPSDGRLGCGDDCLNRMLNIECAQGACPCGELCSNQQFQKRKYAKLDKFLCGKKGYGLKLHEDISQGKFLIEYVGEVLDMHAYEARQKEYALKGHKHFYFMTLNGSEVIDACIKGNKGRFINHSCDPNCRTEKWMVNGEICIGLFALRDIKKGEEVTFDYNYVRVFGAAAKKCYCLSQHCRGYIGGDPLSGDVIIQSDSDEEYPKPRRRPRDNRPGEIGNVICKARPSGDIKKHTADSRVQNIDEMDKVPHDLGQSETSIEEDFVDHSVSPMHDTIILKEQVSPSVTPLEISQQTDEIASEHMSTVQTESFLADETQAKEPRKSLSDDVFAERGSKSDNIDERKLSSKVHSKVKTSRSSSSIKKAKVKSSPEEVSKVQLAANKSQVLPIQPKKANESSLGSRFEEVEEKLNKLLESEGGISRCKDAAKGYLKLLLHTSMSNNEAIQRNRDLSMILDALLKTRSRMVLVDIINKNGLRMLHNIMKQHRGDFKKIPILRKLLKVLEYLALRDILTMEHIRERPPHPGMESFRESILSLTEHDDKQVHQIARNFRDKWIPKNLRRDYIPRSSKSNRYSPTHNNGPDHAGNERFLEAARPDHVGMSSEARRSNHTDRNLEPNDRVKQPIPEAPLVDPPPGDSSPAPSASVSQSSGTRIRKRKSRWDQPAEAFAGLVSLQQKEPKLDPKPEHTHVEPVSLLPGTVETTPDFKDDAANGPQTDVLEDFPPGFSSPVKPPPDSSAATSAAYRCSPGIVLGHPQEKFISRLPVSYGIPMSIVERFGTPQNETAPGSWVIAPGTPFHPFPPLPQFPRDNISRLGAEAEVPDSRSNDCAPSTASEQQPAVQVSSTDDSFSGKRGREESYDLGTKYFKQQKWNHTKLRPPRHWSRDAWGCLGDSRAETNSSGDASKDVTTTTSSDDSSNRHQEHHRTHH